MKERPILFSAPMVRAILDGTKTQTRRVCKPAEKAALSLVVDCQHGQFGDEEGDVLFKSPYGKPGDRLWVRETWNWFDPIEIPDHRRGSRAPFTGCQGERKIPWVAAYAADGNLEHAHLGHALWRPSIHMPRWASRILLEVTSVRVERLTSIREADARAEGVAIEDRHMHGYCAGEFLPPAIRAYRDLWESLNGTGSWDANPWVWLIEFKRITA
jgi:hypothetical protein